MSKWDERFLRICDEVASWSKDQTKVGCVVVGPRRDVRSTGFNGLPIGVDDERRERYERPGKYLWVEHAERNAIYQAALRGTSLAGCTMYLRWYPCADCARAIIQSGITTLVCGPRPAAGHWLDSWIVAESLLVEAGVVHRVVEVAA